MCIKADDVVNGPAALPIGWVQVDDSVKIGSVPIPTSAPNAAKGLLNTIAVVSTVAAAPGPVTPPPAPNSVTPPAKPVPPTAAVTAAAKSLRKVLESLDDQDNS